MMPGSRKLSKVGEGVCVCVCVCVCVGGGGGGSRIKGFFFFFFFLGGGGAGGVGIDGVRTPSTKPWFVHGNYTEDFQNERKNALERHIAR